MSTYNNRIKRGLCGLCGVVYEDGPVCLECKEKCRLRSAAKREQNRKTGCLDCGAPIEMGSRCASCKTMHKESRARVTAFRKENGICLACQDQAKPGCVLCQRCMDARSATSSRRYWERKAAGTCRLCGEARAQDSVFCEYHKQYCADYRVKIKLEAVEAYGGPICVGCGETDFHVLEIDHIAGGGCKHRRDLNMKGAGHQFYLWLRREGYHLDFESCVQLATESRTTVRW